MSRNQEDPATIWVYHEVNGNIFASKAIAQSSSKWKFDEMTCRATNPADDLQILSASTGRDDFNHAGINISTGKIVFSFQLGRPSRRPITDEEQNSYKQHDYVIEWLIVDRTLSDKQRNSVREWLQAESDGSVAVAQRMGRQRQSALVCLRSVDGIDGL